MPTYMYNCEECHQRFEDLVIGTDDSEVVCKLCGAKREHLTKLLQSPGFIFKNFDGTTDINYKGKI